MKKKDIVCVCQINSILEFQIAFQYYSFLFLNFDKKPDYSTCDPTRKSIDEPTAMFILRFYHRKSGWKVETIHIFAMCVLYFRTFKLCAWELRVFFGVVAIAFSTYKNKTQKIKCIYTQRVEKNVSYNIVLYYPFSAFFFYSFFCIFKLDSPLQYVVAIWRICLVSI